MNLEKLVATYVELRDEKAKIKKEAEEQMAKVKVVMDKIEAKVLHHFNETGQNSAATPSGTAYKSLQTSITVADWNSTLPWIQEHGMWQMLDARVNKTAIEEYRRANEGAIPPGVNLREELTINVRRS
jgi:nanoRNase/pAp phosphatase (c-di-AMP/oligoRNAs hydrolase)